jgi:hypothetical protein
MNNIICLGEQSMAVGFVESSPSNSRVFVCLGTGGELREGWLSSVDSYMINPRNNSRKTMWAVTLDEGVFGKSNLFTTSGYYPLTIL